MMTRLATLGLVGLAAGAAIAFGRAAPTVHHAPAIGAPPDQLGAQGEAQPEVMADQAAADVAPAALAPTVHDSTTEQSGHHVAGGIGGALPAAPVPDPIPAPPRPKSAYSAYAYVSAPGATPSQIDQDIALHGGMAVSL